MVISKSNVLGIDAVIEKLQKALDKSFADYTIYPRCYPVLRNNIKGIENYTGNGQDYRNLVYAEQNKFFFTHTENAEMSKPGYYTTSINLFCTTKLNAGRNDSEIHKMVYDAIKVIGNTNVNRIITGIEKVYIGYTFRIEDDMQPWHCFRVVIDVLNYRLDQRNC